jgi:hypothetical protein
MTKPTPPLDPPVGSAYTVPLTENALCCATVRDFIVIGGLDSDPYAIRWNALGDPTDWPIPNTDDARTKQAGQQSFQTRFGVVTGVAGNDFYMYVFQTHAISKGTYVGGDVVFSFDTFEEGRGCIRQGLIHTIDDMVVFESDRGRHILLNDQIQDIGFGITDDTQ